jgi:hypothetical protein
MQVTMNCLIPWSGRESEIQQIRYTLQSISEQTDVSRRAIVKSAGPLSPNARNCIESFDFVKLIESEDKGIYDALNQAIPHMYPGYAHVMGVGDVLVANDIYKTIKEELVPKSDDHIPSSVWTAIEFRSKDRCELIWPCEINPWEKYYYGRPRLPVHPELFVPTTYFKRLSYDTTYKIAGDIKWMLEMIRFYGIPRPLNIVSVSIRPCGISQDPKYRKVNYIESLNLLSEVGIRVSLQDRIYLKLRNLYGSVKSVFYA